jgi:hypothetical protein
VQAYDGLDLDHPSYQLHVPSADVDKVILVTSMLALPLLIETSNLFQPVMVVELIARTSSFFFAFPSLLVPYLLHFWGT